MDIGETMVVHTPALDVFARPGEPASIDTQLRLGMTVRVKGAPVGEQTPVRYWWGPDDDQHGEGFVATAALSPLSAAGGAYADAPAWGGPSSVDHNGAWVQVTSLVAHLFAEPSRKRGPSAATALFESWLRIVGAPSDATGAREMGAGEGWLAVRMPDGRVLHVQAGDVAVGGMGATSAGGAVSEAQRMLHRPYLWGGTTAEGYDCSGLAFMAARRMGVGLPHSSRGVFTGVYHGLSVVGEDRPVEALGPWVPTGAAVPDAGEAEARRSAVLKPGDLVFFAMGPRVDHVGIYADGGEMVHCASSGAPVARREALFGSRWALRMVGVRRVSAGPCRAGIRPSRGTRAV